ncbi:serine hydrolase domain-containing protein [Jidongwangia harbinensis]|uniref:serine hydrolase domain-containing protein n=1 Tax=Jidongwangia harbinensis TaxID=2878561 RepID=UPI001CDA180E|nr:serine hydrolase domain-containing protein [Jidongwangia harbinensis]MCA2211354.1 beta-lactamase family protein [Jidongwangia harbinensis]
MRLGHAATAAAALVADGATDGICYAAAAGSGPPAFAVVGAPLALSEPAVAANSGTEPSVDWLCAGKSVLAYVAVRAVLSGGLGADDDLRPLLATAAGCPPVTLRQLLTYRSGLVRSAGAGHLPCTTDPPLFRPRDWNPEVDAEYTNAGWDLLPGLVRRLTGLPFTVFAFEDVLGAMGVRGLWLRPGLNPRYADPAVWRNPGIRRVMSASDFATALAGPPTQLAHFYRTVLADRAGDGPGQLAAQLLTSVNPGPDFFRRGISATLRWSMGYPARLHDQGFERFAPDGSFGAQGSVLTLTTDGLRYAWTMVAGALPTAGGAFAVTMNGFRPVPDERYRTMAEALVRDLAGQVGTAGPVPGNRDTTGVLPSP